MVNLKCKIEDMIGEALDDILMHYQKQFGITSGDCDPFHSYELDKKTGELAELVVEILKAQFVTNWEAKHDPVNGR